MAAAPGVTGVPEGAPGVRGARETPTRVVAVNADRVGAAVSAASDVSVVMVVGRGPWGDAVAALLPEQSVPGRSVGGQANVEPVQVDQAEAMVRVGSEPRPAVAVITDADPGDRVLVACLAAGVPVVDVHRSIASLDRAREAMRAGTLVAASGWAGGVAALVAAAGERELGGDVAAHVEVDALLAPGDTAGSAWWRRFSGLHRSFMVYDRGQRRLVRGLGEPKKVEFEGVARRARRIASPDQETLVETGHADSAAVRIAFARRVTNLWLALLVGSGAWRFVPQALRSLVLRPGPGESGHRVHVTAALPGGVLQARIHDARGLAHLVAAAASVQVARLLDPARAVPAGLTHPEETDDPTADLAALRRAGVEVGLEVTPAPS